MGLVKKPESYKYIQGTTNTIYNDTSMKNISPSTENKDLYKLTIPIGGAFRFSISMRWFNSYLDIYLNGVLLISCTTPSADYVIFTKDIIVPNNSTILFRARASTDIYSGNIDNIKLLTGNAIGIPTFKVL